MTKTQVMKLIRNAQRNVEKEISNISSRSNSIYSRGLASEGYSGGYRDALNDVILLLNDVTPTRRDYWEQES